MAKQTFKLDYNDLIEEDLFTQSNSDNLINGVTDTGTAQFGVSVGGTGNANFVPGQTIVYDGLHLVSSGSPPIPANPGALINDDRYYTKTEIDTFFASLGTVGGYAVAYANITGAPVPGVRMQFLSAPVQIVSVSAVMGSPVAFSMASYAPAGTKIVAAIITVTCKLGGPDGTLNPAKFMVQQNLTSPQIDAGWFAASGGGDGVAGCTGSLVPVDPTAQSFFYQLISNFVTPGPVVANLIGYFFQ
jgi:hypothetical protein